ncbi:MAG: DUF72 domain-containing protein [Deltaproteobacteria bacterium]|nr:DUF72 domain-containing protein [Deltaproteobacteria bacterium]
MRPPPQQPLFGAPAGPAPAPPDPALATLAGRLPARLRMGTSSWAFPGWAGLVWDRAWPEEALSAAGLPAYAQHPLLRAVSLSKAHYALQRADQLKALVAETPADLRLLVKAHEDLTLGRFPPHARYGARRGQRNPRFLDAAWATEAVVGPTVEGLGPRLGCLLFQLAPQDDDSLGERVIDRLHRFIDALPRGPTYAVEVRNRGLLGPALRAALEAAGAAPCISVHPTLPGVDVQERILGRRGGPLILRWMLRPDQRYASAKSAWAPFSSLAAPDQQTRQAVTRLTVARLRADDDVLIIVGNHAEGSAPLSVLGLAEAVAERWRSPPDGSAQ